MTMEMRLLILDSAPGAERLAESLQECASAVVCRDPGRSSEIQATLDESRANIVLMALGAMTPDSARAWLEHARAGAAAVVLLADAPAQVEALAPDVRTLCDDFALRSATPQELSLRLQQARQRCAARIADAERLSDAEIKRAFAKRLIQAQESERQLLSKELHDGVGQTLLVHFMDAEWLASTVDAGPLREAAERLCLALNRTMESVRNLAMDLRPPSIDDLGLGPALESLVTTVCRRAEIRYEFTRHTFERMPSEVSVAIYRIAQAALDNAVRHSHCKNIAVHLEPIDGGLQLRVIDDGIGFDPKQQSSASWLGLVGMRERADAIGGRVYIDSTIGHGTVVTVVVPESLELLRE